jgi:hypothetical protein
MRLKKKNKKRGKKRKERSCRVYGTKYVQWYNDWSQSEKL